MHNRQSAPQSGSKRKPMIVLIGALVVLAVLCGAYYAYWRIVAGQLEAGIAAWAEQQRALGNEVAFEWDGIGGFPFRFAATFRDPAVRWHGPHGDIAWKGAPLRAEMAPWDLRRIEIASDGEHDAALRLAQDAGEWRIAGNGLAGAVTLYGSGALRSITVALKQPELTFPSGVVLASAAATITLEQPETSPADFDMPLARVMLDARAVVLPPGTRLLTEDAIEAFAFDATIMGPIPAAPLRQALAAWRNAGGVVDLNSFRFAQGPLGLTGNATLALDSNLQPEGAGTVTSTGLREAVEILIHDGLIPPDRVLVARATAKALGKPGPDGKLQATIGLSLQNRVVSFGPVPLFVLQPIAWP